MRMKRRPPRNKVVKSASAFPRLVEADSEFSISQPRKSTAPGEALQIDHPVEGLLPHPTNAAPKVRPALRRCPTTSFKSDNTRQVRVSFQQWRETGLDPPIDFAAGQMP